jgi:hypothetical protein
MILSFIKAIKNHCNDDIKRLIYLYASSINMNFFSNITEHFHVILFYNKYMRTYIHQHLYDANNANKRCIDMRNIISA